MFQAEIPRAIRIAETSAYGQSIFEYDPKNRAVEAFEGVVEQVVIWDREKEPRRLLL